jgi:hypothetical protein
MELNLFYYALSLWLFFFVLNHSSGLPFVDFLRAKILPRLHNKVQYALKCALCYGFWLSLLIVPIFSLPMWYIFSAPSMVLLINLIFLSLIKQ